MEPVRRPVGRHVGAVSPDRAYLLTTEGLPDILALANALPGEERGAGGVDDPLGDRRQAPVQLDALREEDRKGEEENQRESEPMSSMFHSEPLLERERRGAARGSRALLPVPATRYMGSQQLVHQREFTVVSGRIVARGARLARLAHGLRSAAWSLSGKPAGLREAASDRAGALC